MDNFNLRKYLANNPLLNEGLSNKEQMVVDDILSVTEGPKDVYNKLVSYGKKGMMSLAIIASVLTGCTQQGDMDSAKATIEYATENNWAGSELEKFGIAGSAMVEDDDSKVGGDELTYNSVKNAQEKDLLDQEVIFLQANNYFRRLMQGYDQEYSLKYLKDNFSPYNQDLNNATLDYIKSIEDKLKSNPSLTNDYFIKALTEMVKYAKSGELNPMYKDLVKY